MEPAVAAAEVIFTAVTVCSEAAMHSCYFLSSFVCSYIQDRLPPPEKAKDNFRLLSSSDRRSLDDLCVDTHLNASYAKNCIKQGLSKRGTRYRTSF